jgi:N6-L-threonylcarbamoyladenine synthase
MLVAVAGLGRYRVLGSTLDDAVGEAFDKTAKLLGLSYPGGPALAKLAESGNAQKFHFPRPMLAKKGFDFSFSGLKTAVMLEVQKAKAAGMLDALRPDLAASFEKAAIDTLVGRTLQAAAAENADRLVVAGGVGANRLLRSELGCRFAGEVFFPRPAFCTDNGAMIALAGSMRFADAAEAATIKAVPRWPLESLRTPRKENRE